MNINFYLQKAADWILSEGLEIVLILFLALIAMRVAKILSDRFVALASRHKDDPEFRKRTQTLALIIRHILNVLILAVALIVVLKKTGIDITPLIAAAGVVGLAVGFGAKSLVKDVISGFFILIEDQIRVGDVVEIAGKSGFVEKINLKTTILRDPAGNVHYVPNGKIDVVTNMTKDYSRYVLDIGVSYKENVDRVMSVLKEIDEEIRSDPEYKNDILEPLEVLGVDRFADSAVIIRARTMTLPIKQWRIGREFNRRIKKRFDELKIEMPYPHITLYLGEDKEGKAPPLRVVIEDNEKNSK